MSCRFLLGKNPGGQEIAEMYHLSVPKHDALGPLAGNEPEVEPEAPHRLTKTGDYSRAELIRRNLDRLREEPLYANLDRLSFQGHKLHIDHGE